ncbi:MAG: hypothetical protein IJE48_06120 [Clostridia bacterium]|nr:hypothetical protein [Clostridia bacterium]
MRKRKATKITAALLCAALSFCTFFGCDKSETVQTPTEPTSEAQTVTTEASTVQSGSDTPVFMLEKLPEIGEYVDDIICKRRYAETHETLTPGENYGKLIPFVGTFRNYHLVDYETGEWTDDTYSVSKMGIMTDKGEIIVDAVYDWYNIRNLDNGDYIIELTCQGDDYESTGKKLYCNSDGTLVKTAEENVYYNFDSFSDGYIVATDRSEVDWETSTGSPKTVLYDTKWNKLAEIENSEPCYENAYSDGYMILNIFTDYIRWEHETYFVDKNGNIAFEDVHPTDYIINGKTTAKKDGGLYGIFDVSGKWIVQPTFSEMSRYDDYYIGKNFWGASIFDADGKLVKSINDNIENKYFNTYGNRFYLEEGFYDDEAQRSYYEYTDLETGKIITCNETGQPVSQRFDDTEFFYCDDGQNTYIVNFEGRTVAKLPGCGNLWKINDNYFRMIEGHWEDATQKYTVYSFRTFEKVWSDTIVNEGDRVDIWDYDEKFIVKRYTPEEEYYREFSPNMTTDIIDVATGKPILRDLKDYIVIPVGEDTYLCTADANYTYVYAPDMTVLMKVRNERND